MKIISLSHQLSTATASISHLNNNRTASLHNIQVQVQSTKYHQHTSSNYDSSFN
jgi:hypothetical protein